MRTHRRMLLAVLLVPALLTAQELPRMNILDLYKQIPKPPATAEEAFKQCEATWNGDVVTLSTEHRYATITQKLDALTKEIEQVTMKCNAPQMNAVQGMDMEAMKKKMESMSDDEKIQMAMELSKTMNTGGGALEPESKAVNAATEEYFKLSEGISDAMQKNQKDQESIAALRANADKKHNDIEEWERTEESKLPQVSGGEMSAPEPKALKALRIKSADKHIAVENDFLAAAGKTWQSTCSTEVQRFTKFQQGLLATHYGNDAKNTATKRELLNGETLMITPLGGLIGTSEAQTKDAATWYALRLKAEKMKI